VDLASYLPNGSEFPRRHIVNGKMSMLIILIGLVIVSQGCESDQAAQRLAGQMGRLVFKYEASTKAKVEAEQKFYNDQRKNLQEILDGTSLDRTLQASPKKPDDSGQPSIKPVAEAPDDPGQSSIDPAAEAQVSSCPDPEMKCSVAYGRILVDADKDAYLLAETLATSAKAPKVGALLLDFLHQGLRDDKEGYLDAHRRQRQLRIDLLSELEKLKVQEASLKKIRNELMKLESYPSPQVQIKTLLAIGSTVREQIGQANPIAADAKN
jgi:hypothetical protein